ncbi:phosphopantetheine-binding protein [Myxococcota bacterium]|jgi:acyl carrier protein|nr:phosphopantetheine-binding protein [Myxococcota bacterium]
MSATMPELDPDVFEKVREAIAEALGLDEDEVVPEARLMDDLGAESLDFLDIVFRIERAFGIKVPRGGVESQARGGLVEGEVLEIDGVLTPLGRQKLAEAMPEVPSDDIVDGLKVSEIVTLFRVATFYRIVVTLLAEKKAS